MEPEISHRCTSCGAAVRGHALFCPQCGHPMNRKKATGDQEGANAEGAVKVEPAGSAEQNKIEAEAPAAAPSETAATSEQAAGGAPAESATPRAADRPNAPSTPATPQPERQPGRSSTGRGAATASTALAANKARAKIHKATSAARDKLEDNVRPRVEKIRHASTVVLEEASDDPSVRFILVAGALFVLFLLLLILSKVI